MNKQENSSERMPEAFPGHTTGNLSATWIKIVFAIVAVVGITSITMAGAALGQEASDNFSFGENAEKVNVTVALKDALGNFICDADAANKDSCFVWNDIDLAIYDNASNIILTDGKASVQNTYAIDPGNYQVKISGWVIDTSAGVEEWYYRNYNGQVVNAAAKINGTYDIIVADGAAPITLTLSVGAYTLSIKDVSGNFIYDNGTVTNSGGTDKVGACLNNPCVGWEDLDIAFFDKDNNTVMVHKTPSTTNNYYLPPGSYKMRIDGWKINRSQLETKWFGIIIENGKTISSTKVLGNVNYSLQINNYEKKILVEANNKNQQALLDAINTGNKTLKGVTLEIKGIPTSWYTVPIIEVCSPPVGNPFQPPPGNYQPYSVSQTNLEEENAEDVPPSMCIYFTVKFNIPWDAPLGTYNATWSVYDANYYAIDERNFTLLVNCSMSCENLVKNGDFSQGYNYWGFIGSRGTQYPYAVIRNYTGDPYLSFDVPYRTTAAAAQEVIIPQTDKKIELSFDVWGDQEPVTVVVKLSDDVIDSFVPPNLGFNPNRNAQTKVYDISNYSGKTVKLKFSGTGNYIDGMTGDIANIDNVRISKSPTGSDIIPLPFSTATYYALPDWNLPLDISVENSGGADANNVTAEILVNDEFFENRSFDIPANKRINSTILIPAVLGKSNITVIVDPENMKTETNETNNELTQTIEVIEPKIYGEKCETTNQCGPLLSCAQNQCTYTDEFVTNSALGGYEWVIALQNYLKPTNGIYLGDLEALKSFRFSDTERIDLNIAERWTFIEKSSTLKQLISENPSSTYYLLIQPRAPMYNVGAGTKSSGLLMDFFVFKDPILNNDGTIVGGTLLYKIDAKQDQLSMIGKLKDNSYAYKDPIITTRKIISELESEDRITGSGVLIRGKNVAGNGQSVTINKANLQIGLSEFDSAQTVIYAFNDLDTLPELAAKKDAILSETNKGPSRYIETAKRENIRISKTIPYAPEPKFYADETINVHAGQEKKPVLLENLGNIKYPGGGYNAYMREIRNLGDPTLLRIENYAAKSNIGGRILIDSEGRFSISQSLNPVTRMSSLNLEVYPSIVPRPMGAKVFGVWMLFDYFLMFLTWHDNQEKITKAEEAIQLNCEMTDDEYRTKFNDLAGKLYDKYSYCREKWADNDFSGECSDEFLGPRLDNFLSTYETSVCKGYTEYDWQIGEIKGKEGSNNMGKLLNLYLDIPLHEQCAQNLHIDLYSKRKTAGALNYHLEPTIEKKIVPSPACENYVLDTTWNQRSANMDEYADRFSPPKIVVTADIESADIIQLSPIPQDDHHDWGIKGSCYQEPYNYGLFNQITETKDKVEYSFCTRHSPQWPENELGLKHGTYSTFIHPTGDKPFDVTIGIYASNNPLQLCLRAQSVPDECNVFFPESKDLLYESYDVEFAANAKTPEGKAIDLSLSLEGQISSNAKADENTIVIGRTKAGIYNISFAAFDGTLRAELYNAKIMQNISDIVQLDNYAPNSTAMKLPDGKEYTDAYSISTPLNFNGATVMLSYTEPKTASEANLKVYKCDSQYYNYTARTCAEGQWKLVPDYVINTTSNTITINVSSFSGFAIGADFDDQPSTGSSGSGGGSGGSTSESSQKKENSKPVSLKQTTSETKNAIQNEKVSQKEENPVEKNIKNQNSPTALAILQPLRNKAVILLGVVAIIMFAFKKPLSSLIRGKGTIKKGFKRKRG